MNTEITDSRDVVGRVFYDADCALCVRWMNRFRATLESAGFSLHPLQSPGAARILNVPHHELLNEMRVLTAAGISLAGADAVVYLARNFPGGKILSLAARIPGTMPVLRKLYRLIAHNRSCGTGACHRRSSRIINQLIAWTPLLVLTAMALAFGDRLVPFVYMFAICGALYFGCKWLTFWNARTTGIRSGMARSIAYLLAWPGMNAADFLGPRNATPPGAREIVGTAFAILFGGILISTAADPGRNTLLVGWMGLVGFVLVLHFGFLHLTSMVWRTFGINAAPLMRSPWLANSLADFWGRRWNTAFHHLVYQLLFRPTHRRLNVCWATLIVFGVSGVVHELAISVPARGGYGLPSLYFLIQAGGVLLERSFFGRRLGLGKGIVGRLFMLVMTAGPVFGLFHPRFVNDVILPLLKTLRAL